MHLVLYTLEFLSDKFLKSDIRLENECKHFTDFFDIQELLQMGEPPDQINKKQLIQTSVTKVCNHLSLTTRILKTPTQSCQNEFSKTQRALVTKLQGLQNHGLKASKLTIKKEYSRKHIGHWRCPIGPKTPLLISRPFRTFQHARPQLAFLNALNN